MKHKYVKRIVIESTKEFPSSPIVNMETEDFDDFDFSTPRRYPKLMSIENISLNEWTVRLEYGFTEKFSKVAAIVGEAKALEVLQALDG